MKLNWEEHKYVKPTASTNATESIGTVYHAECVDSANKSVVNAIQQCIDKTMNLLSANVVDESRYLMFEWDKTSSTLTIAVTDHTKENDSENVVKCIMSGLDKDMQNIRDLSKSDWDEKVNAYSFDVKYSINEHLTTCNEFLRYSLIAAFHSDSRKKSILI